MKVRDQRSHTYPDAPKFKENGVWIDLYKMIKTKAIIVPQLIAEEAISYLNRRLAVGGLTQDEYNKRIRDGQLLEKLKSAKEKNIEGINNTKNTYADRDVYIIWSASKVILEEEWVKPLKTVTFEGLDVTGFAKVNIPVGDDADDAGLKLGLETVFAF